MITYASIVAMGLNLDMYKTMKCKTLKIPLKYYYNNKIKRLLKYLSIYYNLYNNKPILYYDCIYENDISSTNILYLYILENNDFTIEIKSAKYKKWGAFYYKINDDKLYFTSSVGKYEHFTNILLKEIDDMHKYFTTEILNVC